MKSRPILTLLLFLGTVSVCTAAVGPNPWSPFPGSAPVSDPSNVINAFNSQSLAWLPIMQGYADRLFLLLAGIDFLWTCLILAGEKPDLLSWFVGVFRKFMAIGIFLAFLQFGPGWMQDIIDSFSKIGIAASGIGKALTASSILADGMNLATKLLASAAIAGALADFASGLGYILASITMLIAYVVICIHFVKATIDTYLSVRAAFIFLGFGGSRWTSPYSERYITLVIASGVRLMSLYLIIGIGHVFAANWWFPLVSSLPLSNGGIFRAWSIAAGTVIYASICWASPKFIAGLISGAPTLSGSDVIGFATPMAQAGLAAGTFGATAAAGVAATIATGGLAAPVAAGGVAASTAGAAGAGMAGAGSGAATGAGARAAGSAAQTGASFARTSAQPAAPKGPGSGFQPSPPTGGGSGSNGSFNPLRAMARVGEVGQQMLGHVGSLPRDGGGGSGPDLRAGHGDS